MKMNGKKPLLETLMIYLLLSIAIFGGISTSAVIIRNNNTIYVGGSGPDNYTTIQSAINDANNGDTVFVYDDSSPYFENVVINKPIFLIGEDKNTTIIDAEHRKSVIKLESNNITVSGFTLQNSGSKEWLDSGIQLGTTDNNADYCTIFGNKIINNSNGISLLFPTKNIIEQNIIIKNKNNGLIVQGSGRDGELQIINNTIIDNSNNGIIIRDSDLNIISGNVIMNNGENGIRLESYGNSIFRNVIKNHTYGIRDIGGFSHFYLNIFEDNNVGLFVQQIRYNIEKNNFINNDCNAKYHIIYRRPFNRWNGNYWDDFSGIGPKVINGISSKYYFLFFPYLLLAFIYALLCGELPPWLEPKLVEFSTREYDWHPAQEPYDI